mmetsp:Transcript_4467/g.9224  ORF Transcript_4467/g.9224 Transcript_4467/m.9224 type:complete len:89 (-) Transcript_4467:1103-1369(-)
MARIGHKVHNRDTCPYEAAHPVKSQGHSRPIVQFNFVNAGAPTKLFKSFLFLIIPKKNYCICDTTDDHDNIPSEGIGAEREEKAAESG